MASFLLNRLRNPLDVSREGAVLLALSILHIALVLVVTVSAGM